MQCSNSNLITNVNIPQPTHCSCFPQILILCFNSFLKSNWQLCQAVGSKLNVYALSLESFNLSAYSFWVVGTHPAVFRLTSGWFCAQSTKSTHFKEMWLADLQCRHHVHELATHMSHFYFYFATSLPRLEFILSSSSPIKGQHSNFCYSSIFLSSFNSICVNYFINQFLELIEFYFQELLNFHCTDCLISIAVAENVDLRSRLTRLQNFDEFKDLSRILSLAARTAEFLFSHCSSTFKDADSELYSLVV